MKSDNELIAEFMGMINPSVGLWYLDRENCSRKYFLPGDLAYDSLWDWLMPVVKKIRPLWCKNQEEAAANMMSAMFDGDIEITYRYVLEFIKWYSLQLK
jgi:hypothetical protein